MTSLTNRTFLVTGAGSGIGRSAARMLAEQGAEVILIGRRLPFLQETLPNAPPPTHASSGILRQAVALDHADDRAVEAFARLCPPLDGMFLNAGHLVTGSVEGTDLETFERMLALNLRGPWLMAHHLGPKLKIGASVVLTGSNIGLRAIPDSAAYSIAKAGVHMLAKILALEWAPRKIRCNAIAPGPVHTAMVDERLNHAADPAEELALLSAVNPLKRLGTEEEIAALALHLLGPESSWTTGTVIPIDGGAGAVF